MGERGRWVCWERGVVCVDVSVGVMSRNSDTDSRESAIHNGCRGRAPPGLLCPWREQHICVWWQQQLARTHLAVW